MGLSFRMLNCLALFHYVEIRKAVRTVPHSFVQEKSKTKECSCGSAKKHKASCSLATAVASKGPPRYGFSMFPSGVRSLSAYSLLLVSFFPVALMENILLDKSNIANVLARSMYHVFTKFEQIGRASCRERV